MLHVDKLLTVSYKHISQSTLHRINTSEIITASYPHLDGYGVFLFVPEEEDASISADLNSLLAYARAYTCNDVLIDVGSPII